jgi:hypothetical protein
LYQQGDERSDCGAIEPSGNLAQTLIDGARIEVFVELFMNVMRDVM